MARVIFINLVLFFLPFILYGTYAYLVRKDKEPGDIWSAAPINWLFFTGGLLVFGTLIYFVSFQGGDPEGQYKPAIYKDGNIQDGHFEQPK